MQANLSRDNSVPLVKSWKEGAKPESLDDVNPTITSARSKKTDDQTDISSRKFGIWFLCLLTMLVSYIWGWRYLTGTIDLTHDHTTNVSMNLDAETADHWRSRANLSCHVSSKASQLDHKFSRHREPAVLTIMSCVSHDRNSPDTATITPDNTIITHDKSSRCADPEALHEALLDNSTSSISCVHSCYNATFHRGISPRSAALAATTFLIAAGCAYTIHPGPVWWRWLMGQNVGSTIGVWLGENRPLIVIVTAIGNTLMLGTFLLSQGWGAWVWWRERKRAREEGGGRDQEEGKSRLEGEEQRLMADGEGDGKEDWVGWGEKEKM